MQVSSYDPVSSKLPFTKFPKTCLLQEREPSDKLNHSIGTHTIAI